MNKFQDSLAHHIYTTKLSVCVVYALTSSIAINFFYQPGHIYSSGITGFAQIFTTLSEKYIGRSLPIAVTLFLLNVPLFLVAWKKIGKRFTIFTVVTVTLSSLAIQLIPETVLTSDPIICAIFGGGCMGFGIGFALKNGISSGGLDIISITIRKKTGKTIGSISIFFNVLVIFGAGVLFGWQYMFYSALSIFVSGKVTDAIYTKQKKMQVIVVTKCPDQVISAIQNHMRRGITIIHEAEGAYKHDRQTVLLTVVTRYELPLLEYAMKESDPQAFVSISDNVKILGRFYEEGV